MKRKPLSWELAVGKEEENGKVWGQPCGQGAAVQRWEVAVSPRRSACGAGKEGLGWTGSAGLCSAHRQAPPTSPPPSLWSLALHTVHLRHQASTLVASPPQELPQHLWLCLLLALYPRP